MHNIFNTNLNHWERLVDKYCQTGNQNLLEEARRYWENLKDKPQAQEHLMQHALKSLPKIDRDMTHWMNDKFANETKMNWLTCKKSTKTGAQLLVERMEQFDRTVAAINCFKPGHTYQINYDTYNAAKRNIESRPLPTPVPVPTTVPAPTTEPAPVPTTTAPSMR